MLPTPVDLWHWIQTGGFIGLLAVNLVALIMGWIIPLPLHKEILSERDKRLSDQAIELAALRAAHSGGAERNDRLIASNEQLIETLKAISKRQAGP